MLISLDTSYVQGALPGQRGMSQKNAPRYRMIEPSQAPSGAATTVAIALNIAGLETGGTALMLPRLMARASNTVDLID